MVTQDTNTAEAVVQCLKMKWNKHIATLINLEKNLLICLVMYDLSVIGLEAWWEHSGTLANTVNFGQYWKYFAEHGHIYYISHLCNKGL